MYTATLSFGSIVSEDNKLGLTSLHSFVPLLGSGSSTRHVGPPLQHYCPVVLQVQCSILLGHGQKGLHVQAREPS